MDAGEIAIKVTLNETPLEKKLRKLESKLEKEKIDLEVKQTNYDDAVNELARLQKEFEKTKQKSEELTATLESKKNQLEQILSKQTVSAEEWRITEQLGEEVKMLETEQKQVTADSQKYANAIDSINEKLPKIEASYEKQDLKVQEIKNDINGVKNEITQMNNEAKKSQFDDIKNSMSEIGKETSNVLTKVAKWGLAVFSVRSAYMLVRQAVSTLSQYDEKISADIQYIRFALASALKPIIETIIDLVYKLLAYIGYIAKAWFGVNLFANATAKNFQKVNKGVKDTNKSAQKLQKTLAGFDEMNILQDTGATTTGGGGGGVLPSQDLSKMLSDVEVPSWIKWLADNGELVKNIIIGIAQAFGVWKVLTWVSHLGLFAEGITGVAKAFQTAGLIMLIMGVYGAIQDVISIIADPSWENFHKLIGDLSLAIMGLGAILVGLNTSNPLGWVTLAIGAIGGLIYLFSDTTGEVKTLTQANKDLEQSQKDVNEAYNDYVNAGKSQLNAFENAKKAQNELKKVAKKLGITQDELNQIGAEWFELIKNGDMDISELTGDSLELYKAYLNNQDAQSRLKTATDKLKTSEENLIEVGKKDVQKQLEKQRTISNTTGKWEDYRDVVIKAWKDGAITADEASGRLGEAFMKTEKSARASFTEKIPSNLSSAIKDIAKFTDDIYLKFGVAEKAFGEAEKATNNFANDLKKQLGTNSPNYIQKSIDKVNKLTDAIEKLRKKGNVKVTMSTTTSSSGSGMKTGGILKLASGSIINQPGRGVPLRSNVIGGEAGREGILPLTDSQAMAQLGYEIGRYITVNAQMNNYMNGRLISKELQTIQNQDDFAFNR